MPCCRRGIGSGRAGLEQLVIRQSVGAASLGSAAQAFAVTGVWSIGSASGGRRRDLVETIFTVEPLRLHPLERRAACEEPSAKVSESRSPSTPSMCSNAEANGRGDRDPSRRKHCNLHVLRAAEVHRLDGEDHTSELQRHAIARRSGGCSACRGRKARLMPWRSRAHTPRIALDIGHNGVADRRLLPGLPRRRYAEQQARR